MCGTGKSPDERSPACVEFIVLPVATARSELLVLFHFVCMLNLNVAQKRLVIHSSAGPIYLLHTTTQTCTQLRAPPPPTTDARSFMA